MYKTVWCTCEVVVVIKPIVFWRSRCRSRRWNLKSLFPGFVAPREVLQVTLGFWILRHGFQILGTGFQIFASGTWIPIREFQSLVGFWIHWVVFRIPKPWIPDSTSINFQHSGFLKQTFPGFRFTYIGHFRLKWQTLALGSLCLFSVAFEGLHYHTDCLIP